MVSCFFIAARFELADEFPNTQPRSGAGVREEPPEEVPIKSGKSESPRPKEAGYRLGTLDKEGALKLCKQLK